MIFRSIKLSNFRQYKGNVTINFSTDENKNVTVLMGDNGSGKTTLLQAFNWCFYKDTSLQDKELLLNQIVYNDIYNKGINGESTREKVMVTIEFEHKNSRFICETSQIYEFNDNTNKIKKYPPDQRLYIIMQDGVTKKSINFTIDEIFPKKLSNYFLFDGERMENLSGTAEGKKDLSNAVTNMLGLDLIKNAIKYFNRVRGQFGAEMTSDHTTEMELINNRLKDNYEKKELTEQNIIKGEETIHDLRFKLKDYARQLEKFQEVKIFTRDRESYERDKSNTELRISNIKNDTIKEAALGLGDLLISKLLDKLQKDMEFEDLNTKGLEGIQSTLIDQLIERKECICGEKIELNDAKYKKLIDLKQYLPPQSLSGCIKQLYKEIANTIDSAEKLSETLKNKSNELIKENYNVHNYEKLIKEITTKIESFDNDEILRIEDGYQQVQKKLSEQERLYGATTQSLSYIQDQIKTDEKSRDSLVNKDESNKLIKMQIDVCDYSTEKLSNFFKTKEIGDRKELQSNVSELISLMLNQERKVELDDSYNFSIIDKNGNAVLSEGQEVVASFAFVGGIIKLAKRVLDKSEFVLFEEEEDSKFALVMDAPFAKLDSNHRNKVVTYIPKLTDQIILFTSDTQYDTTVQNALKERLGAYYELKYIENNITEVVGGDKNAL